MSESNRGARLPAIDLLESVGEEAAARRIWEAVGRVLTEGRVRTPDLGGSSKTSEVADAIIATLR